ncbi:MAG TPA: hemerythrin domain-containing protein [Dongiaceae bacterium]|nr:hemerythrin domain-containing protein [Dongiaceae bacterium]
MARIDLYRNVHKGQRAHLFSLAVELGRADHEDTAKVDALAARLRAALAGLRRHAENEERFIHPLLLARAPKVAAMLEQEHRDLEPVLRELEDKLDAVQSASGNTFEVGMELYRAWCRMLSAYLGHIDAEERAGMSALWDTCTDEEIFAVIRTFAASRTATEQIHDLTSQAPALSPQERALLVASAMKGGAPAEPVWASLAAVLPSHDLARLRADVGIGVG